MEEDAIKRFIQGVKRSGILQELKRRSYFMTRTQRRKFKDLLNMKRKKKAEARRSRFR